METIDLVAGVDVERDEVLRGAVEEKPLTELGHVEHELLHHLEHVAHQDIALQLSKGIREHLQNRRRRLNQRLVLT